MTSGAGPTDGHRTDGAQGHPPPAPAEPDPAAEPTAAADPAAEPDPAAPIVAADPAAARRLAEIFGEVLPETTSDDHPGAVGDRERWYVDNRPPHHDTG